MSHIWIIACVHNKLRSTSIDLDQLTIFSRWPCKKISNWKIYCTNTQYISHMNKISHLGWFKYKPWLLTADLNKINLALTSSILEVKPQEDTIGF